MGDTPETRVNHWEYRLQPINQPTQRMNEHEWRLFHDVITYVCTGRPHSIARHDTGQGMLADSILCSHGMSMCAVLCCLVYGVLHTTRC